MSSGSNTKEAILAGIAIIATLMMAFFYFKPWTVERMYVSDKVWRYTIQECEDYSTTDCSTTCSERKVCTTSCKTTKHTRVIREWTTEGNYKIEPYFPTNYAIRSPYYERRQMWFRVFLKTGDLERAYDPWNYNDYSRLKYENVYTVTTNVYGIVTRVE